ncbi:MAG TPA: dihydrodipicolinate synthase family protein [Lacipirellulaceae bacterium]|jgi:4-hydroxy-tetrahydrodipicolinate synthase
MTTTRELAQPIRGIIPPMVTPLADQSNLDHGGVERLVEHLLGGGVHGLFILGSCGEGLSLGQKLRRELADSVCRQVEGRVPVLVSITDTSRAESIDLARFAADAGADAVVLAPPCYYTIDQDELVAYVRGIVRELPLPLVLYNMPALTKVTFEPETVRQLLDETAIVGLKDSSGDLRYFESMRTVMRERRDWALLTGAEHLLARSLELGGDGGVCGGANVWPQLFVQIYEGQTSFMDTTFADHQEVINDLVDKADRLAQIYRRGPTSASSLVKGLKAALAVMGICGETAAAPLQSYSAAERRRIEQVIQSLGIESTLMCSLKSVGH